MKRKMWAAALAASMVMSAFSGMTVSAAEADSDLSGTLTILSWYDETKAAPVLEAFKEKYPNVNVDFQYSPPVQDYVEKLSTLLYSGAGPDIFYMALENREDLIKGGYCLDLSDESYMTDGTIPDSVKTTYGKDGKAYALAVDCWVGGILVNQDLFEQAGIESDPTIWDELLEDCQKLQDAGITPIMDNCQDTLFGGFAPNSETAKVMSENLGYKTVLSGSVSKGKNDPSQSLQMIQRPLMTTDELKSMPKGNFILMKTGKNPMKTKLRLYKKWGIELSGEYKMRMRNHREVEYASMYEIESILKSKNQNIDNIMQHIDFQSIKRGGVKVE